jgi:hypothetical protein
MALAAALLGPPGAPACAGVITSFGLVTPFPNNDDVTTASPNVIELAASLSTLGPHDLVLTVQLSGGVTEYEVLAAVINNTGRPWSGFRLALGVGVGAAFVPATELVGLDFDLPGATPPPTGGALALATHEEQFVRFDGGLIPPVFSGLFSFALDVSDAAGETPYSFTLRFEPEPVPVPAPASLLVLGPALLALAALLRARRPPV